MQGLSEEQVAANAEKQVAASPAEGHVGANPAEEQAAGQEEHAAELQLVPVAEEFKFDKGALVCYTAGAGTKHRATILKVHYEDIEPYYTILMEETGRERQTDKHHLSAPDPTLPSSSDSKTSL